MTPVTQAQIDAYDRDGCVHVPGVFGRDQIDALASEIIETIERIRRDGRVGPEIAPRGAQNPPDWDDRNGAFILRNCVPNVPAMHDFIHNSVAGEVVGRLMGADHVHFWIDASFLKEGDSPDNATPWHNDVCTFSFWGQHMPSFWVALTDVERDNAPLVTLRGSHRVGTRFRSTFSPKDVPLPPGYQEWDALMAMVEAAPAEDKQVWTCAAGDILLIHPDTIHASLPRTAKGAGRRLAFTARFLGSDPVWNPNPLTFRINSTVADRMRIGDGPPDDLFPIVWRRPAL